MPDDSDAENRNAVFEYVWGQYRIYAATSRGQKASLEFWRKMVLTLTLLGAIAGMLSQQFGGPAAIAWGLALVTPSAAMGILSAVLIALAGYFGQQKLKPETEQRWIQSRSAAEAFKSEAYHYCTGVAPYDTADALKNLSQSAREIEDKVSDVRPEIIAETERKKHMPARQLSVQDYIKERIKDQVDDYYLPKSREHMTYQSRFNFITFLMGAVAVVFGALSGAGLGAQFGGWIAVISTATTAITAHLAAGRHNQLSISYYATAQRLQHLVNDWEAKILDDRGLIQGAETTIAMENAAWMAKYKKGPEGK